MKKSELLKSISFFEDLTDYEIALLSAITQREIYEVETTVFEENSVGNSLYIVAEGAVRISKMIQGAGEEALSIIRIGHCFGEMALIDELPRSASAISHEECILLKIEKDDFDKLLYINKKLAYKILWAFCKTLSNRLRNTDDSLKSLSAMAGW